MTGVLHLKLTICFVFMTEIMPESHRSLAISLITAFDSGTLMVICIYFKFFSRDVQAFYEFFFYLGVVFTLVLIVVVPESPSWLIVKQGPNSKDAIDVLNYMAWFNGVSFRIPKDAYFDVIGQAVEEDLSVNRSVLARHRFQQMTSFNASMITH